MLTREREKASNETVRPSREEKLLSDQVFHLFGRTITLTGSEQLLAVAVIAIAVSAWAVQQFRRRRAVILQRSVVSDQLLYELSRIADALDRLASRPIESFPAQNVREFREDEPRTMPFSMFGRER